MASPLMRHWFALVVLLGAISVVRPSLAVGQQGELTRKVKTKVPPVYPEVAQRMGIGGTVKLSVVVAPDGSVKSSKVLGGHPTLASAAQDAIKKWKFESAREESTGVVEFTFKPDN
jgi:TonB family protein